MIETFQPAQIADMDHTTDAGRKFNKHTIRSDIFYETIVFASLWEPCFNGAPWIFAQLFDGQAHLTRVLVKRYDTRLVFITELEEFLCIDWCIGPGNFTNMNKTFNTRHDFEESTVVFDVHYFALPDFAFFNGLRH